MTPTQFKAKTRNFAAEKHLNPQIVQRYYMMEKLLECIVESPYHDDFVLKGGFLIGSKYGLENRSTVDIDTTYRNSKLTKEKLETVFSELTADPTKDGIRFELKGLTETREADYYPGFQAKFIAYLENARVPFKLDITSGDSIIPAALMYEHKLMFEDKTIHIPAYPTEQILAEKLHATFSFGKDNSRMKDFYDLYMIPKLERIDEKNLYKSVQGTFKERNNQSVFRHLYDQEMPQLVKDEGLREKWKRYQQENYFAKDISFESTLTSVDSLMQSIVEKEKAERKQNFKRSQQMNHVKHYTDIEQVRFPDMTIQYDLRSVEFLLPALSVQPLVENAIKHGLMGLEKGGIVTISAYETDDSYIVEVTDDGVGFDMSAGYDETKHVGIKNIRGRIEAMCGGTLTIESEIGKGTKATIRIPKEAGDYDSNNS